MTALVTVSADIDAGTRRLAAYLLVLRDAAAALLEAYDAVWRSAGDRPAQQVPAGVGLRLDDLADADVLRNRLGDDRLDPIVRALGLDPSDEFVLAAAWWGSVDPQLALCFGLLHDDAGRRYPTPALLRLLLQPFGVTVPLCVPGESRLVRAGLLQPAPYPDHPLRPTTTVAMLLDGWRPSVPPAERVAARLRPAVDRCVALLGAGQRITLRCTEDDDATVISEAVAGRLGRQLEGSAERPVAEQGLLRELGLLLVVETADETRVAAGVDARRDADIRVRSAGASAPRDSQVVDVPAIGTDAVRAAWRMALGGAGLPLGAAAELGARMRLTETAVGELTRTAQAAARIDHRHLSVADLHDAVRRHPQHSLDTMARLLTPSIGLDDLVLSDRTRAAVMDLLAHVRYSAALTAEWPGTRGRAVVVLFQGPSGTGKTAAAEAIAAALARDLWIVDLAQVVSKWIGETQRNLDTLLTEADRAGAILLFDEAEGLFGRRGEVADARDRYANLEIDHLLQRIELHEGVVILTSNRPAGLDQGFQRRMRLSIRFELPAHGDRLRLWRSLLPAELVGADVDLARFADAELSFGAIRGAALGARVFATADAADVTDGASAAAGIGVVAAAVHADHLHRAVSRELEKNGRSWSGSTDR